MSSNPFMVWLIYSPFHRMVSNVLMVINYRGSKSGKAYKLPVGYKWLGNTLLTISFKHRKWWRNLRGGTPVTVRSKGKDEIGNTEVIEDDDGVAEGITRFIAGEPRAARMFRVDLDDKGQPEPDSLIRAVKMRVIVRTNLK